MQYYPFSDLHVQSLFFFSKEKGLEAPPAPKKCKLQSSIKSPLVLKALDPAIEYLEPDPAMNLALKPAMEAVTIISSVEPGIEGEKNY